MSDRRRSFYNNEEILTNVVIAPDGGWGWFIVFSSFLYMFLIDGANYTFGIYIAPLTAEFNRSIAEIALLGSVMAAISYLIGPFVSALLNNYDFRFVAILGTLITTGGYVGASFATNYWFFFGFYSVVSGIGYGMMLLPGLIAPNFYFMKWRALATALASCGTGVGTMVLPPLVTFLLDKFKWRNTLRIMSGIILVFGLFGITYKPLKPQKVVNKATTTDSFYITSMEMQHFRKRRCCICCGYSNKYYPTTADIVPAKGALLEDFQPNVEEGDTISLDTSIISRRLNSRMRLSRFSYRQSTGGISLNFTQCTMCWYSCLYVISCQPCQLDVKPFHRDDIFYDNSISMMPKYKKYAMTMKKKLREQQKMFKGMKTDELERKLVIEQQQQEMEYNMDVTRVTVEREHWWKPNCHCSLSTLRTLATMLHCDLFKSCAFLCLSCGMLCFSLGYGTALIYLVDRATSHGIPHDRAFWLLSGVGGANTLGRVLSGLLPCVVSINVCLFVVVTTALAGAVTVASDFYFSYWYQMLYSVLYGFFSSANTALRTVVNVELFGLENLNNVYGLQLLLSGMAILVGPVIGGALFDYTKAYFWSYMFAGICLVFNALFIELAKVIRDREIKKEKKINLLSEGNPITV